MKKMTVGILMLIALVAFAQVYTPINRGRLQSDLDGGGKGITNLNNLTLTNSFTNTAWTAGGVPYSISGGGLRQDTTNLFWDSGNKRLGIRTNAPSANLEINTGADTNIAMIIRQYSTNQTADLMKFKDGNGNDLFTFSAKGRLGNIGSGIGPEITKAMIYVNNGIDSPLGASTYGGIFSTTPTQITATTNASTIGVNAASLVNGAPGTTLTTANTYSAVATGISGTGQARGGGIITDIAGAIGNVASRDSGTVILNGYSFLANSPQQVSSSGSFSNAFGVYVRKQNQTFVTNAWGLYQADAGDSNYFAGHVQAGSGISLTNLTQGGIPIVGTNGLVYQNTNMFVWNGTNETIYIGDYQRAKFLADLGILYASTVTLSNTVNRPNIAGAQRLEVINQDNDTPSVIANSIFAELKGTGSDANIVQALSVGATQTQGYITNNLEVINFIAQQSAGTNKLTTGINMTVANSGGVTSNKHGIKIRMSHSGGTNYGDSIVFSGETDNITAGSVEGKVYGVLISNRNAKAVSYVSRAHASQTNNLIELQDSAGSVFTHFDSGGRLGIKTNLASANLEINTGADTNVAMIIRQYSTNQSVDLMKFKDGNGNDLFTFSAKGRLGNAPGFGPELIKAMIYADNGVDSAVGAQTIGGYFTSNPPQITTTTNATTLGVVFSSTLNVAPGQTLTRFNTNYPAIIGLFGSSQAKGGGAVEDQAAMAINVQTATAGTLVKNSYTALIRSPARISSNGSFSNVYGLYVEKLNATYVTNAWGLYQEDAGDSNYFAGSIKLGSLRTNTVPFVDTNGFMAHDTNNFNWFQDDKMLAVGDKTQIDSALAVNKYSIYAVHTNTTGGTRGIIGIRGHAVNKDADVRQIQALQLAAEIQGTSARANTLAGISGFANQSAGYITNTTTALSLTVQQGGGTNKSFKGMEITTIATSGVRSNAYGIHVSPFGLGGVNYGDSYGIKVDTDYGGETITGKKYGVYVSNVTAVAFSYAARAHASQTGNLFELQDSTGSVFTHFDSGGRLTMTNATAITSPLPVLRLDQTWNNGAVDFSLIQGNVTDTASSGNSYLVDLKTATVPRFRVYKDGTVLAGGAIYAADTNVLGINNRFILPADSSGNVQFLNWASNGFVNITAGTGTFTGGLTIGGAITATNEVTALTNLWVGGTLRITNEVTSATNAFIGGNLTVTNNVTASGTVNGAAYFAGITTKTTNYTSGTLDSTILMNADSITNTLPTAIGITGRIYTVKVIEASPTDVTIATTSSQTIDGVTTYTFTAANESVMLQSDGANWQIIAKKP